jgi:hypothetical protein
MVYFGKEGRVYYILLIKANRVTDRRPTHVTGMR